jgi:selenocysteine lyase/cysteine desulfurase
MLSALRAREFSRLARQNHAYLDYTGSALYGESQLRAQQALLENGIFGNPHSDSAPSRASTELIERARERVLRFFNVDASTHAVCFTANTSAAIRLVAESYPFGPRVPLVLSADNHNSVNGMRELARRAGAAVRVIPLDDELRLRDVDLDDREGLLAFPAQSNFSGVLHPLSLVDEAKRRGYDVLLDVAAFAPTHALDLRRCPADYVVLSFYKLFGLPTGLGALIARRESLAKLARPSFAGGTVLYASVRANAHRLRPGPEGFEDGTPNFLGIATLDSGFDLLERVGMQAITAHVSSLASQFVDALLALPHVRVYGPRDMRDRGGIVTFNVRDVPYAEVESRAREAGVSVRGGCFCNPGASEAAFELDPAECLDTLGDAFTIERFAACIGRDVGAIRVSPGLASNEADIARMIEVVAQFGVR